LPVLSDLSVLLLDNAEQKKVKAGPKKTSSATCHSF